jgi:hypothetical protein
MISSTGLVHIAALFAIAVIIVTEIRLGKDHCKWIPILTTIVGYLMPQPQFSQPKKKEPVTSSMLHLDPEFGPLQDTEIITSHPTAKNLPEKRNSSYRALFVESLPSIALFTAVAVWAAISLSSEMRSPQEGTASTLAPAPYEKIVSTLTPRPVVQQEEHSERFGSLRVCEYLRNTVEENGLCQGGSFEHTVVISNGTLGMCYIKNKEIGAKLQLTGSNSTFYTGYTGWRLLLFRMSRISDRLHKQMCNDMTLGYRNETASSCNGQVIITGYPDQITLSAHQWNEIVFFIPDVLLAMMHCRSYTDMAN